MENMYEFKASISQVLGIKVTDAQAVGLCRAVLDSYQVKLFRHELKTVKATKIGCAAVVSDIIHQHFPFHSVDSAIELLSEEIINESMTPNLTESVNALMQQ